VVLLDSVGENFNVNFPETQFQTQKASMNLLRNSGALNHFWTRNLLEIAEEKVGEIRAKPHHKS
jgi:hypothetical protein